MCAKTSYHPKDYLELYCGHCHRFLRAEAVRYIASMTKGSLRHCLRLRYDYHRYLSQGRVARYVAVQPLLHGQGLLFTGEVRIESIDDAYFFEFVVLAVVAAGSWLPEERQEPLGWYRHVQSGRRRWHGNPLKEYALEDKHKPALV